MESDDARDFRRRQAYKVQRGSSQNIIEFPERYTARKGSAHRAKKNSKSKKLRLRLASLILAAGIGIGGISVVGSLNKQQEPTLTQLQEIGIDINKIGLEDDTLRLMEKYDEYFANFDENEAINLTDNDVIEMIDDISRLNVDALKDKMADLTGETRDNIKLDLYFNKGDGEYYSSIIINEGKSDEEEYKSSNAYLLGIGKKDSIPDEVSNLIIQTEEYSGIIKDLKADKITKINAIKKLEELYAKISSVLTKQFSMDEKGNVSLDDYKKTDRQNDFRKDEER